MERLFHGRDPWAIGGTVALGLHAAVLAWVLQSAPSADPPPAPAVMTVELLASGADAATGTERAPAPEERGETPRGALPAQAAAPSTARPSPPAPPTDLPALPVPPTDVPLAEDVTLAEDVAPSLPVASPAETVEAGDAMDIGGSAAEALAAVATSPRTAGAGLSRRERDYFAHLSAHLNRRKEYPVEARQARQQGVVVVRFGIDRDGNVLFAEIKRGSGHALLDEATLALLKRVSPLPRIPRSLDRDRLTLSLPIDYSLTTD